MELAQILPQAATIDRAFPEHLSPVVESGATDCHVPVSVKAPGDVRDGYQARFLVDTGAIDSMAPSSELRKAGIQPVGRKMYELADGSHREYRFGLAQIEFMGEITAGRMIFGPEDAEPFLGVTALEAAGVTIDPMTQTLRKLPAVRL